MGTGLPNKGLYSIALFSRAKIRGLRLGRQPQWLIVPFLWTKSPPISSVYSVDASLTTTILMGYLWGRRRLGPASLPSRSNWAIKSYPWQRCNSETTDVRASRTPRVSWSGRTWSAPKEVGRLNLYEMLILVEARGELPTSFLQPLDRVSTVSCTSLAYQTFCPWQWWIVVETSAWELWHIGIQHFQQIPTTRRARTGEHIRSSIHEVLKAWIGLFALCPRAGPNSTLEVSTLWCCTLEIDVAHLSCTFGQGLMNTYEMRKSTHDESLMDGICLRVRGPCTGIWARHQRERTHEVDDRNVKVNTSFPLFRVGD